MQYKCISRDTMCSMCILMSGHVHECFTLFIHCMYYLVFCRKVYLNVIFHQHMYCTLGPTVHCERMGFGGENILAAAT